MPDDDSSQAPPEPPPAAGPGEAAAEGDGGPRRFVADTVRKAVFTGLGAVFLTEESARRLAREWKLPKEIVGYVTTQAAGAKDEILRIVAEEIRKFFESPALRREALRMLGSMSIEVHAEISLKPARGGKGAEPKVSVTAVRPKVRRSAAPGEGEFGGEGPGEDEP